MRSFNSLKILHGGNSEHSGHGGRFNKLAYPHCYGWEYLVGKKQKLFLLP